MLSEYEAIDIVTDRGVSYARAAGYLKGPFFMPYGEFSGYHTVPTAHLYLGMDNVTRRSHFAGMLDEVSLYGRCFAPDEVEALSKRGYGTRGPGVIVSDPIGLEGPGWGIFQAEIITPPGTSVRFDLLAAQEDRLLKENIKPGEDLTSSSRRISSPEKI